MAWARRWARIRRAIGIDKAKAKGVAVVALRNSGHLGRIGDFAEMAAAEGLVSLHFVNVFGSLLVAPFGGAERRFSTNPVAIGVPTAERQALHPRHGDRTGRRRQGAGGAARAASPCRWAPWSPPTAS